MKRMQKYKDEGIQHFYFMMLQKDEVSCKSVPFLQLQGKSTVLLADKPLSHNL